jgi:uncharacterized membrane protein AbrB (regulator of aidB expression)
MNNFKLPLGLAALFILIYEIYPREAHAYIDPGTGSIMLQVLIGILVGLLFSLKMFWKKIKSFFKGLFAIDSNNEKKQK